MATAVETQTSNPLAHVQDTQSGALVHNSTGNNELVHSQQQQHQDQHQGTVARQPRPQSAVWAPETNVEEAERPGEKKTQQFLPWYTRWGYNISLGAAQGFLRPASFIRDTQDAIRSPLHIPEITKTYECRKLLPVR